MVWKRRDHSRVRELVLRSKSVCSRNAHGAKSLHEAPATLFLAFWRPNTEAASMEHNDERTAVLRRVSWLEELCSILVTIPGRVGHLGLLDLLRWRAESFQCEFCSFVRHFLESFKIPIINLGEIIGFEKLSAWLAFISCGKVAMLTASSSGSILARARSSSFVS